MSISKEETDIILNKANIALARSQRLVASWLPASTLDNGPSAAKSEEELQREEDEIFTAVPETLGLGAPLPSKAADGSWNRKELDSNDQLRRQLLGRNYKKVMAAKNEARTAKMGAPKGQLNGGDNRSNVDDDDDDEDEGRTASIGRKGKGGSFTTKRKHEPSAGSTEANEGAKGIEVGVGGGSGEDEGKAASTPRGESSSREAAPKGRKKATSFLDEILAERSKKRRKK